MNVPLNVYITISHIYTRMDISRGRVIGLLNGQVATWKYRWWVLAMLAEISSRTDTSTVLGFGAKCIWAATVKTATRILSSI